MKWWVILLLALLALYLIGRLRLGARVKYDAAGLAAWVLAGPVRVRVWPARERAGQEKKRPGRAKREKPSPERPGGGPGTLERVLDLLPVVGEAAGALRRKMVVNELEIEVVWGASSAAAAAIGYGRAHAALGMIWPIFEHNFRVKRHRFQVDVDYAAQRPEAAVDLKLTMTLGQALAFALRYGGKALMRWSRSGRERPSQRRQEA